MNLANHPIKRRLESWALTLTGGKQTAPTVCAVGQAVIYGSGRTTPEIVGVDPVNKRVLTQSGYVYQLGMPFIRYAVDNRATVATLGF